MGEWRTDGRRKGGVPDPVFVTNDEGFAVPVNIIEPLDDISEGVVAVDFAHHEIHEGDAYNADAVDESMGSGDTLALCWRTGATVGKWAHLLFGYAAKTAAHIELIEGPTWNAGTGAQHPIFNRNRNSAKTSDFLEDTSGAFLATMNLILNPTGLAGGVEIHDLYTWSDKKETTADRDSNEFILAVNTTYALVLTADVVTNAGQIFMTWYEHTNG